MLLLPIGASEQKPAMRAITVGIAAICVVVQLLSAALRPAEVELVAAEVAVEKAAVAILVRHGLQRGDAGALFGFSDRDRRFVHQYATNPAADPALLQAYLSATAELRRVSHRDPARRLAYTSDALGSPNLLLSAFAHADWAHLLTNLVALVLFGSLMELRWGRKVYLALYLGGAIASALTFLLVHRQHAFVVLGASGAVAATMGAMLVSCYGRDTRYWYALPGRAGWRTGAFSFPSIFVLPLWIAEQLAFVQLEAMGLAQGVAFSGHVGGFAFGGALALGLRHGGLELRLLPDTALPTADEPAPEHESFGTPAPAPDARGVPADERLRRALHASPSHALAPLAEEAIQLLVREGHAAELGELYRYIEQRAPGLPLSDRALAAIARACCDAGALAEAATLLKRLLASHAQSPAVPGALWHLAAAQERAGDLQRARACLTHLATRYPSDAFAAQARLRLGQSRS